MQLKKQYNGFAKDYSHIIKKKARFSRRIFYNHFDFPLAGKKVLDAGCGDGTELLYCIKQKANAFGIDSSEGMVNLAKQNVPLAKVQVGDFAALPFPDRFFDIIISKHAMQSSADVGQILEEFHRVLKPKGSLLYLSVHPLRQFMERKKKKKDYFHKEKVESVLFGGLIKVMEPTHTFNEYLNPWFLKNFDIHEYEECFDPESAEKVEESSYPGFFIIKAQKRK